MAQKRTSRTKTTAKSRRTQKKRTKKGKVYIAPYKIIILCAAIIAICMGLLVVTTAMNQRDWDKQQTFLEEQKKEEARKAEEKRLELEAAEKQKKAEALKKEEARKAEEKRRAEEKAKADKARAEKEKAEKALEAKKQAEIAAKKKADEKKSATKPAPQADKTTKPAVTPKKEEEPVRTPNTETKVPAQTTEGPSKTTVPSTSPAVSAPASKFNFPQAKNGAQLVILLDDGGQNLAHLQKFLDLPFPITIAVLPQLAHSKESAAKVRASGKELMLHQPMQAINTGVNPGPGAITPNMDEAQIKATLFKNISEIGPIAGFNNHEGSLITADAEKMETVLKYASENGIYFLDSRTNVNTTVPAVASALGLSYYERNGRFLDNVKTRDNVVAEIRKNLDIANRDGVVIMIGHIWSADFMPAALMEVYPELLEKGYKFKTVSECRGLKR